MIARGLQENGTETHVNTWEECEQRLLQFEQNNSKSPGLVCFRGISNARWRLTTTLERYRCTPFFVADYWKLMSKVKSEIESFTGLTWEEPEWSEPDGQFGQAFTKNPAFGYMAHLRHYGFPSPLLDWSLSRDVAAYFAFAGAKAEAECKEEGNVAIYAFSEMPNKRKWSEPGKPTIYSHGGHNLKTDERHLRQKACYTVCVEKEGTTNRSRFVPHQKFQSDQDLLYKITVPSSERAKVLSLLDRDGLNEFSLFGSEDALMETLAFREIAVGGCQEKTSARDDGGA